MPRKILKPNKVTLFLLIGYNFNAKKELPRLMLLFVKKSLILSGNPICWRLSNLNVHVFYGVLFFRKTHIIYKTYLFPKIDLILTIFNELTG